MTFMKGLPLLLLVASLCSHAALQPDRTRIVFNANDKATSLRVDNRSDKLPYLAYSWLENEKGEKSDDLLVALPPILRIKVFWRPAALRKKAGEKVELQLQVSQQGNQLTLKNPTAYYLTIAYLGRNEKGVLPGFKTVMVAPFSTVNTNTGNYSGSQFYLGYMDDYGALRMTTLNCSGQCHLQAVEAKK